MYFYNLSKYSLVIFLKLHIWPNSLLCYTYRSSQEQIPYHLEIYDTKVHVCGKVCVRCHKLADSQLFCTESLAASPRKQILNQRLAGRQFSRKYCWNYACGMGGLDQIICRLNNGPSKPHGSSEAEVPLYFSQVLGRGLDICIPAIECWLFQYLCLATKLVS